KLGGLVQTARLRPLADLDVETAGGCGFTYPGVRPFDRLRDRAGNGLRGPAGNGLRGPAGSRLRDRFGHAFGGVSGSSATHSSSSARSACHAAYTTPAAAATPSTTATTEPMP